MIRALVLCLTASLFLSACTTKLEGGLDGGRVSPTVAGPKQKSFCSTINGSGTFTSEISVSGTATYARREVQSTGGLGGADPDSGGLAAASRNAIRKAEVTISNASGTILNCAETADDGTFTIYAPAGSGTYTVSVNSRIRNGYLKASVMNRPESKRFYSVKATVDATTNSTGLVLEAPATGELTGGAFNILDRLLTTNEYLINQTGLGSLCSADFAGCLDFTTSFVASDDLPIVEVYWEKGFNPNDYFGGGGGLSFYVPGYSRIFILGGIGGDTDSTDTDHFDTSVIVHEYGHFLEDALSISDSPGGSHNGDAVIDPRLAWSEGWGNFIQAAVRGTGNYIDTVGNIDGDDTYNAIEFNLENLDGYDTPDYAGEGNFRELSVSRILYDAVDGVSAENANGGTDLINGKFKEIWAAFTKTTRGLASSTFAFRSIGHLHLAQVWMQNNADTSNASNWSGIRTLNRQDGDTSQYAQLVSTACAGGAATGDFTIDPMSGVDGGSSLASSHMLLNNNYYHLKITSTASYTVQLRYKDADGVGTEADLDLYLYNSRARIGVAADVKAYSQNDVSSTNPITDLELETAGPVTLSPGNYLINVNAYTGSGGGAAGVTNYSLYLNGVKLCPANLVQ